MRVSELGLEGGNLLHGSDLAKAKLEFVGVIVSRVRQAPPSFNAPVIIEFEHDVVPGIAQWAANQTETNRLGRKICDNTEEWAGWGLILQRVPVTLSANARRGRNQPEIVDGIVVADVVPPSQVEARRKSPKTKDAKGNVKAADVKPKVDLSKIPF